MNLNNAKNELLESGFTILRGVITPVDLAKFRILTDEIINYSEEGYIDPFEKYYMAHRTDQGALYDLFYRHPEFSDIARNPKILDTMSLVLGEDIFLYENSLVYKPKGKANEVPWHQDFINRPTEPKKYIAWVAFDDVTVENGAMKILPGSHKGGFRSFFTVPNETHHTRLRLDGVDVSNYQYATMNAGDVLIFDQLVIHSSDRIDSPLTRRAYRFACQGFDQIITPRATPIVLKGGRPVSMKKRYGLKPMTKENLQIQAVQTQNRTQYPALQNKVHYFASGIGRRFKFFFTGRL